MNLKWYKNKWCDLKTNFSFEINTAIKTKVLRIENDRANNFTHANLMFSLCP